MTGALTGPMIAMSTVGSPDPVTGRWLRAFAIAAFIACGVVMCLG